MEVFDQTVRQPQPRFPWLRDHSAPVVLGMLLGGLAVAALVSDAWTIIAWSIAGLFALLGVLAAYFWGTLLFGSALQAAMRRTPVPWSFGAVEPAEHDIDPGIELMAAGVLAYYEGHPLPRVCTRTIPVKGLQTIRPFVVARTGWPRTYAFEFTLSDEDRRTRFAACSWHSLDDAPSPVLIPVSLSVPAQGARGRRWVWRVRAGVTTVSAFHVVFSDEGGDHSGESRAWIARLVQDAAARGGAGEAQSLAEEGV